jgi:hypothetical protein
MPKKMSSETRREYTPEVIQSSFSWMDHGERQKLQLEFTTRSTPNAFCVEELVRAWLATKGA